MIKSEGEGEGRRSVLQRSVFSWKSFKEQIALETKVLVLMQYSVRSGAKLGAELLVVMIEVTIDNYEIVNKKKIIIFSCG